MRLDYPLQGMKAPVQLEVEVGVLDCLKKMENHTGFTLSELANIALKRFISSHQDFLPPSS